MSITIPKWVRVLDGVTDPLGGSGKNLLSARNGIRQILDILKNENCLPKKTGIKPRLRGFIPNAEYRITPSKQRQAFSEPTIAGLSR
jgi:hypothetical protein